MGSLALFPVAARRLEGKVALITGGASGICERTARLFSKHGAKVMIADIQDELAHSVCKDLGSDSTSFIHCDITEETDMRTAVDITISQYGKLDIMFNNAGIAGTPKPSILDIEKAEFEQVIRINLVGSFLGTKHATRVMIPAHSGSIITMASISSVLGGMMTHAYTCSKHAVVGLTKNTAVELGRHGIGVKSISPNAVPTTMAKRFLNMEENEFRQIHSCLKGSYCKEEDVAEAALFLGSSESKFVSGHKLVVDGGFHHEYRALLL